jgi:hypothetical protein
VEEVSAERDAAGSAFHAPCRPESTVRQSVIIEFRINSERIAERNRSVGAGIDRRCEIGGGTNFD